MLLKLLIHTSVYPPILAQNTNKATIRRKREPLSTVPFTRDPKISKQLSKLALDQSSHTTILTQVQDSLCNVEQNLRESKSSLDSLLAQFDIQSLARHLDPTIKNIVSHHISLEIQRNHEKLRFDEVQDGPSNATISQSKTPEAGDAQYEVEAGKRKLTSTSPHSNIKRRRLESFKSYNLWFGKLQISTETCKNDSQSQLLRTEVILLPAPWLIRKGAAIMIDRVISASVKPVINYSIRPLTIISNHSPIFSAIADGNIHSVQEMFTKGMASPFDHTSKGENILRIVFNEIFNIAFEDSQWDKLYGDVAHAPPRKDALQLIKRLKSFARSLIELGVDAGCRDNTGWSPFHTLCMSLSLDLCPSDDDLYLLAEHALDTAKSNPLFFIDKSCFIAFLFGKVPENSLSPLGKLQDKILENDEWQITSNHGGYDFNTFLIRILYNAREVGSIDWDMWRPSRNLTPRGLRHRSVIVEKLMSATIGGMDDLLAKLDDHFEANVFCESATDLHCAIKVALIEGSPLKRFGRPQLDYETLRQTTVKDVTCMLSFNHVIAEMSFPSHEIVPLTQWAEKWQVLDLWRKALRASPYHMIHITRRRWSLTRHLYDLEDESEGSDGAEEDLELESDNWSGDSDREDSEADVASFEEMMASHPAYGLLT